MHRRTYLTLAAGAVGLTGCVGRRGTIEPASQSNASSQGDEVQTAGADTATHSAATGDELAPRAEAVIHHWPCSGRTNDRIEDTVGTATGVATAALENVDGPWRDGHAEFAAEGTRAHVDLGYLEAVNRTATERSFGLFTTVRPTAIASDRAMTIFGAGGGDTNWLEVRLNDSAGGRRGQPMLFLRDDHGRTISAAADRSIPVGSTRRVGVSLSGPAATDIRFFIDGQPVGSHVAAGGRLTGPIDPAQSYGLFASNPTAPRTIGTRRWFSGYLDDVILTDVPITPAIARADFVRTRRIRAAPA